MTLHRQKQSSEARSIEWSKNNWQNSIVRFNLPSHSYTCCFYDHPPHKDHPPSLPTFSHLSWRMLSYVFYSLRRSCRSDCYNSHGLFSFLPTLTPLWLISLTLTTHRSHTYSTVTHISHAYDSLLPHLLHCDSSTPIVLLLYIWLDTHL